MVGNLFVGHSLHQGHDDVFFALAQCVLTLPHPIFEHHLRNVLCHITLLKLALQPTDGRHENVVLHLPVLAQPSLVMIDVVQTCREFIVV